MSEIPLRLRLNADFGVELDIEGGTGKKTAPIIVTARTVEEAVTTQMQVLRCIGKGRRIAWHLLSQEAADIAPKAVRTMIETVEFAGDEVITQQEGWYFVLEALPAGYSAAVPGAPRIRGHKVRLAIPVRTRLAALRRLHGLRSEGVRDGLLRCIRWVWRQGYVYVYRADCPAEVDGADVEAVRRNSHAPSRNSST